jgi:hypothetical protein
MKPKAAFPVAPRVPVRGGRAITVGPAVLVAKGAAPKDANGARRSIRAAGRVIYGRISVVMRMVHVRARFRPQARRSKPILSASVCVNRVKAGTAATFEMTPTIVQPSSPGL